MGNRTFLHTTDVLPSSSADAPEMLASVAEGNNWLPPLWSIMLAEAELGPAQDFQQIFLPSVYGGIYADRDSAHTRLFAVLDFIASDPRLPDPARFRQQIAGLRDYLDSLPGAAYGADLNEWFHLDSQHRSPEGHLDNYAREIAQLWRDVQEAMACADFGAVARLLEFNPLDPLDTLGFQCWGHRYFWSDDDGGPSRKTFAQFCADDTGFDWDRDDADVEIGRGLVRFTQNGKVGLRRAEGSIALPAEYDDTGCFYDDDQQFITIEKDGLTGTLDSNGNIVIAPCLEEVFDETEGYTLVKAGRYGYLDVRGDWFVRPRYDDAFEFAHGMAPVTLDGREGYLSAHGEELFGNWTDCGAFNEAGIASVSVNGLATLINSRGEQLIPAQYAELQYDDELQAWSGNDQDGNLAVFLADGTPWFHGPFDEVTCLVHGGDAIVEKSERFGVIARGGSEPAIAVIYTDYAMLYDSIYALTDAHGRTVACYSSGEHAVPAQFDDYDEIGRLPSDDAAGTPADLVAVTVDALVGVWSVSQRCLLVPCEYASVCLVRCDQQAWYVMTDPDGAFVILDAGGQPINTQRYDWLGESFYGALQEDWQWSLLQRDIAQQWSQGGAIEAGRGGMQVQLFADGREIAELDALLRKVASHPQPVLGLAPPVMHLPLPARAPRPSTHVIAGVGDPQACFRISQIYRDGLGVEPDPAAGLRWLATAAAGGHQDAQYEYAFCLMEGLGGERDIDTARRILEQLGAAHRNARNCLGVLHESHLDDEVAARALYEQAAAGGDKGLAAAQVNAGRCWHYGIGGPVDLERAIAYYEAGAFARAFPPRQADPSAAPAAVELLLAKAGDTHRDGDAAGCKLALHKACTLLKQMLADGNGDAALTLARAYLGEFGGERNVKAARRYLEQALADSALNEQAVALRKQHRL